MRAFASANAPSSSRMRLTSAVLCFVAGCRYILFRYMFRYILFRYRFRYMLLTMLAMLEAVTPHALSRSHGDLANWRATHLPSPYRYTVS
jgi:hypothetical protein